MQTVNIGILAHVDAGKTSLTERLSGVDSWVLAEDDGELLSGLVAGAPVSQRRLWTVLRPAAHR